MIEDNDRWDEDIESLNMERSFAPSETPADLATRLLNEAAPQAAMSIARLATARGVNERVQLSAAQYVIDRVCGKIGDARAEDNAPWADVFAVVTSEA